MTSSRICCGVLILIGWLGFDLSCHAQFWQPQFIEGGIVHSYAGGFYGGGTSFADFDKDGWDDVFLTQNGAAPLLLKSIQGQLQPWPLAIDETGEIKQLTWVDFDNDGDRDLSLTGYNMLISLYRNEDDSLINRGGELGIPQEPIIGYGHSWADYDRDSDLDLFVCTYDSDYLGLGTYENRLYRNDGDVFTDVSSSAGFQPITNFTFMAIWMDYNRDLYPDLFVSNDRTSVPNYFYHNNGDGTFTEIGAQINLDDYMFAMTATSDDFDNDGDLDIYVTNGSSGNAHKVNQGDGTFLDGDVQWGTTVNRFCWGALFVDADRDGWQDLHICSTPHITLPGQNMLYLNNGETFTLANDTAGIASDNGWSHSNAIGDFNRDGLADLSVNKDAPNFSSLWRALPNSNHWLKVTLEGVVSNRDGISSWIDCYTTSGMQSRYTFCGEGYLSQNSFSEFFGLGENQWIDSLVVSWPSGIVDRWYRIPADQQLYLVEGTSRIVVIDAVDGIVVCASDSLQFNLLDWPSVNWSNGDSIVSTLLYNSGSLFASVEDQWGNVFLSDTLEIVSAPEHQVEVNVQAVSCFGGQNGSIEVSSETGNLEFDIEGLVEVDGVFGAVPQGVYSVRWEDDFGCTDSTEVEVSQPEPFLIEAETHSVSCHGASDGSVDLLFSGGTPNYFLMANSPSTSELSAGTYTYVASDSLGCLSAIEIEILQPQPIEIEIVSTPEIDGNLNGSIAASVSGGTPPYSYFLNGLSSPVALWEQLAAGVYLMEVYDSLGCDMQEQVDVDFIQAIFEDNSNLLSVFPNPVSAGNRIGIHSSLSMSELSLYNSQGACILAKKPFSNCHYVETTDLLPGCYMLYIRFESGYRVTRLFIVD